MCVCVAHQIVGLSAKVCLSVPWCGRARSAMGLAMVADPPGLETTLPLLSDSQVRFSFQSCVSKPVLYVMICDDLVL